MPDDARKPPGESRLARFQREPALLLFPGLLLLLAAFFFPMLQLFGLSVTEGQSGQGPFTLKHFEKFFVDDYYIRVAWRTFRLSLIITLVTLAFGFPLAYIMSRASPRLRLWLILLVILPLMTSVVIRTFGWLVILGRGGLLSTVLEGIGLTGGPTQLMHTETGIVIAMAQVLLPFMALTIMGVMARIDVRLEEAARIMGAGYLGVIRRVILPLSLPGIVSGCLLVFALSISSFVTPTLVGGVRLPVMAGGIYQSITGSFDWNFAAAQSVLLLVAALAIIIPYSIILRRRTV